MRFDHHLLKPFHNTHTNASVINSCVIIFWVCIMRKICPVPGTLDKFDPLPTLNSTLPSPNLSSHGHCRGVGASGSG